MNEDTNITLDEMIEQLGGTPTPDADPPANTDPTPAPAPANDDPAPAPAPAPAPNTAGTEPNAQQPSNETPPAKTEEQPPNLPDQKAQQAFVFMRQQNKRMSDTLRGIASLVGVDPTAANDENKLMEALQAKITEQQARDQNVPVELLQRLQHLEARDKMYTAREREQAAALGFQRLKDTYGLSQTQLNQFAQQLVASGKNPLTDAIDLEREYKLLNFDKLVEDAVNKAVAAERNRAANAANHSTTPSNTQGGLPGNTGTVKNVHELNEWLKANVQ